MKKNSAQKAHLLAMLVLSVFLFSSGAFAAGPESAITGAADNLVSQPIASTDLVVAGIGDSGFSPSAATVATRLGETGVQANEFSKLSPVTGKIYVADSANHSCPIHQSSSACQAGQE